MLPLLPLAPSAFLSLILLACLALSALLLDLDPPHRRIVAVVWLVLLCLVVAGSFAWLRGLHVGVLVIWTLLPLLGAVVLSLPIAIAVRRLARRRPESRLVSGSSITRRAALGLPLAAGATAAVGFVDGVEPAKLRVLTIEHAGLHPDLDGLRILQLSDLHFGTGLDMRDARRLVRIVAFARPDIVVLTGDVADSADALLSALPILETLAPRFGIYAVLGNHEYMSGSLEQMTEHYANSQVDLLIDETRIVEVGSARLAIAGIDDPYAKHEHDFFEKRVAACAPATSLADFSILLSHRPEALDAAADAGIHLTLAGHTHGGQVGLWGRSVAEKLGLAELVWGFYRRRGTTLYTSAGAGDWFPFRLGCPREAPLFVLRRAAL